MVKVQTIIRNMIIMFLICMVVFSGLQIFSPYDADRNCSIDLRDSVLSAMALFNSEDCLSEDGFEDFERRFKVLITSMNIAAGLETVIQADRIDIRSNSVDPTLLFNPVVYIPIIGPTASVSTDPISFATYNQCPPTPPPRWSI